MNLPGRITSSSSLARTVGLGAWDTGGRRSVDRGIVFDAVESPLLADLSREDVGLEAPELRSIAKAPTT